MSLQFPLAGTAQTAPITSGSRGARDATIPPSASLTAQNEEVLVEDDRAAVRPALMVENKLSGMLKGSFVRVSELRLQNLIQQRFQS